MRSSTCENRRPLLEERPRSFGHVMRSRKQREVVRLEIESIVERRLGAAYDRLDARRERKRTVREHLTKHVAGARRSVAQVAVNANPARVAEG